MNPIFRTENFFNLLSFDHSYLFEGLKAPWKALTLIERYLKGLSLGKIDTPVPEGVFLEYPEMISIGVGTKLEPGCFIRGPCIIGKDCEVRHGAYIRGNVIVGDRCVIGHASELKNCVFLDDAKAGHFAYIGDSILGNHVNLGAGTKCANLLLSEQEVVIHYKEETIPTGLRKFGAIIGDGTQIGCNAVTNPGTILGKNTLWYPGIARGGVFLNGETIKIETKHSSFQ